MICLTQEYKWCQKAFEFRILKVESGYSGGIGKNPSYAEVCAGKTGHAEVAQIIYDVSKTSLEEILKHDISVKIINSNGNMVHERKLSPLASKQFNFSVQDFKPGISFYIIESKNECYKGKFIVQ